jgi:hypothetical protein
MVWLAKAFALILAAVGTYHFGWFALEAVRDSLGSAHALGLSIALGAFGLVGGYRMLIRKV